MYVLVLPVRTTRVPPGYAVHVRTCAHTPGTVRVCGTPGYPLRRVHVCIGSVVRVVHPGTPVPGYIAK